MKKFFILGVIPLLIAACDQTKPTAPTAVESTARPEFASAGPVVATVTGDWTIDGVRVIAFTAIRYADGTVSGQWERVNIAGRFRSHGDVTCLSIVGNQAWIGTLATSGAFLGGEGGFRVVDNGEGRWAPPDQVSLQFINLGPGGAADYCANVPESPPLNTVGAGNVQIR